MVAGHGNPVGPDAVGIASTAGSEGAATMLRDGSEKPFVIQIVFILAGHGAGVAAAAPAFINVKTVLHCHGGHPLPYSGFK
jgi:hypothetical protein